MFVVSVRCGCESGFWRVWFVWSGVFGFFWGFRVCWFGGSEVFWFLLVFGMSFFWFSADRGLSTPFLCVYVELFGMQGL